MTIYEEVRRCPHCNRETTVSAEEYRENPFCNMCLNERIETAALNETLHWDDVGGGYCKPGIGMVSKPIQHKKSTSFIVYTTNFTYLKKTIDDLIDNTNRSDIEEIIICADSDVQYDNTVHDLDISIIRSANIGRAKAWNKACDVARGDTVVFLKESTKFSPNWFDGILTILSEDDRYLVSAVIHVLDPIMWSSEPNRWKRFGFRWDLNLYDRFYTASNVSPVVSSSCIAVNKQWFMDIGRFDDGMIVGSGEDIELSIRNYMFGGLNYVADNSMLSCVQTIDAGNGTINNKARIASVWFGDMPHGNNRFYMASGIKQSDVDVGRIDKLLELKEQRQVNSIESYINRFMPELFGVYPLKDIACNKRIAIVAPGASLDYIDNSLINSFDIIIGVDYVGKLFKCDYVITNSLHVIADLRQQYNNSQFILPMMIRNDSIGENVATRSIIDSKLFEFAAQNQLPQSVNPPFCDFNSIGLTAVHFGLFLGPSQITLFGFDNKLISDRSHTTKIEYYDDGKLLNDSSSVRKQFAFNEYCLDHFGKLANSLGIPVIRVTHA